MNVLAAGVLAATLGLVFVRQLRARGLPIWVIFVGGAAGMLLVGGLSPAEALEAVVQNRPVLVFLFALFVFVAALDVAGALEHLARWILERARRPDELPLVLFVAVGVVSAFVVNDALVLVGVPVLISVARRSQLPPEPLLLTLAFSVTVGSTLTPFGNPQNLLVSLESGLTAPVNTFFRYLLLPTVANLVVGGLFLRWAFARELRAKGPSAPGTVLPREPLLPTRDRWGMLRRAPVVAVFPATMVTLIVADLAASLLGLPAVPLDLVILGGAVLVLATTGGRLTLLRRVDWSILALFAGLFVVVAGAVQGGVVQALEAELPIPGPQPPTAAIPAILLTSLVGPQIVSNVPWVGLQIPAMLHEGYGGATPIGWMALAAGATLAGNVTLLGAASNLIIAEQAERHGVQVGLRRFAQFGLPLTAITVGILAACLYVGL